MSENEVRELSKAEWKVMKIVWQLESAVARDVYTTAAEEQDWSPTTVKTLLHRLVQKGYLQTTRVGNSFVYRPAKSAIASLRHAVDSLLTNAIEGVTAPLIAHMVESVDLTANDLAELRILIDDKKKALEARPKAKTRKRRSS